MTPVIFKFVLPSGELAANMTFVLSLNRPGLSPGHDGVVLPEIIEVVTDAQGMATVPLYPSTTAYQIVITNGEDNDYCAGIRYKFYVPASVDPVYAQDLFLAPPPNPEPWDEEAIRLLTEAKVAAQTAAANAKTSELAAKTSETNAGVSATSSSASAAAALASKNAAKISQDAAKASEVAAAASAASAANKQPLNANLTALSAAVAAINGVPYFTSLTVMGTFATTSFSRGLMNSADAATFRTAIALGNVNNTSDADKPISIATQAALNSKLSLGAGGVMSTNQNFEPADVVSAWQGNRWVGYTSGAVQGPPAGNATYGFHIGASDSRQFKMQIDFATGRPWYLAGTAAGIAANAWKRGFIAGDYGIGGRSSESLLDFNVTRDSGIYGVSSGTLNPPVGFLGGSLTLLMNYNDSDSFEFVSKRALDGRVGWRRKVSGTYGPWIYPLLPGDGGLLMPPGSNLPWPSGNLDSIIGAVNGGEYVTVGGTANIPLGFNPCTISYAIRVVDAASEAGSGAIQCTQTIKNLLGQVAVRSASGVGNQATPPWGSWNITATAGVNSNITSLTGLASITSSVVMSLPTKLATFTLATLPSAPLYSGCTIMVSNAAGGAKQCTSNGTVWQITNTTTTVS